MWICKQYGLQYQQHHNVILLRAWLCYKRKLKPSQALFLPRHPFKRTAPTGGGRAGRAGWLAASKGRLQAALVLLFPAEFYYKVDFKAIQKSCYGFSRCIRVFKQLGLASWASSLMIAGKLCSAGSTPSSSVSGAVWMISCDTMLICAAHQTPQ